jgi:hypothetical protein
MVFSTISSPYVAGIMAAGFTYLALKALSRRNNNMPPLPPGPPRRPIIGNLVSRAISQLTRVCSTSYSTCPHALA